MVCVQLVRKNNLANVNKNFDVTIDCCKKPLIRGFLCYNEVGWEYIRRKGFYWTFMLTLAEIFGGRINCLQVPVR